MVELLRQQISTGFLTAPFCSSGDISDDGTAGWMAGGAGGRGGTSSASCESQPLEMKQMEIGLEYWTIPFECIYFCFSDLFTINLGSWQT